MTKPQDYTVKQFISEIRTIIEANPDKVNAFVRSTLGVETCVYENQQGEHCIIGEWLDSIGLLTSFQWIGLHYDNNTKDCIYLGPGVDDRYPDGLRTLTANGILSFAGFNGDVAELAGRIQTAADMQVRWKVLLEMPELSGN